MAVFLRCPNPKFPSPFGELFLRRDVDLVLHASDLDHISQVPRLAVHLDPLFEKGFLLDRAQ